MLKWWGRVRSDDGARGGVSSVSGTPAVEELPENSLLLTTSGENDAASACRGSSESFVNSSSNFPSTGSPRLFSIFSRGRGSSTERDVSSTPNNHAFEVSREKMRTSVGELTHDAKSSCPADDDNIDGVNDPDCRLDCDTSTSSSDVNHCHESESLLGDGSVALNDDILILWNRRKRLQSKAFLPFQADHIVGGGDLTCARALDLEYIHTRAATQNLTDAMHHMDVMLSWEKQREDVLYDEWMQTMRDLDEFAEPEFGHDNLGWYKTLTKYDDGEDGLERRRSSKMSILTNMPQARNEQRDNQCGVGGYHEIDLSDDHSSHGETAQTDMASSGWMRRLFSRKEMVAEEQLPSHEQNLPLIR